MRNPMEQRRQVIKMGAVIADNSGELDLPEVDEDNPHGARCAACGELLCGDPLICIDCDDDKNFGEACRNFYERGSARFTDLLLTVMGGALLGLLLGFWAVR